MTEVRIIKKYPNRRLYDTAISSYITLEDIRQLVLENTAFKVCDAKTDEDLTHATLLQIIAEQESQGNPLLTNQVLQDLIRQYGNSVQNAVGSFLEQSMSFFLKHNQSMVEKTSPLQWMNDVAKQNMQLWQSIQQQFVDAMSKKDDSTNL